jgi:prevent-host-death family protein
MSEAPSVPLARARDELADLVNRASYGGERVILTRRGRTVAALIPAGDLDLLEALEDERDARLAQQSRRESAERGDKPVPFEDVMDRLGITEQDMDAVADEDDGLDANWHGAPVELGDR